MRYLLLSFLFVCFLFVNVPKSSSAYDPKLKPNNKIGIHILYPSELSQAAELINSSGGDWGYVIIPIQANDKNLEKWQDFMDNCTKHHIIPIIRIATTGDYFTKGSWSKPSLYDVIDFANFLNDLSWPTKNRYVVIFNEPNRGDEWGGIPNAAEYAQILNLSVDVFKKRSDDFFIISAGLDNASININNISVNNYTFMIQMDQAVPGVFAKIDGLGSHSYPNPAFSSPPSSSNRGIYSWFYQNKLARELSNKDLPVFITETGWTSDKISENIQAQYYINAYNNYWNNPNIIAITPFILIAEDGPFAQFSFIKKNVKTKIYFATFNYPKIKGSPLLNPAIKKSLEAVGKLPTESFKNSSIKNIFMRIGTEQKTFFKWLLGI